MTTTTITLDNLRHFTGSENWFRHALMPSILYTDGIQYLAEQGGAYWLLDEIALAQTLPAMAGEEFQLWQLTVIETCSAVLSCSDGNGRLLYRKSISFTDFPLREVRLYCVNRTILLPSEY